MNIQVGTLAIAKRSSGVCAEGEYGVCYEVYELGDRPGYAFIFEQGGYDGFSPYDAALFLEVLDLVVPSVAEYTFMSVGRLVQDYRRGRFAEALQMQAGWA